MSRIDEYLINCCEGCGCDGLPKPISTTDKLLYHLAEKLANIGGGGGAQSDWNAKEGAAGHVLNRTHYTEIVDTELASGEHTSAYIADYGCFCCSVPYHTEWEWGKKPNAFSITFDGVEYKYLQPTKVEGFGTLAGNFSMLNAVMGTAYENTGEPFLAYVGENNNAIIFVMDTTATAHEIKISYPITVYHPLDTGFIDEEWVGTVARSAVAEDIEAAKSAANTYTDNKIPLVDLTALLSEIPTDGTAAEVAIDVFIWSKMTSQPFKLRYKLDNREDIYTALVNPITTEQNGTLVDTFQASFVHSLISPPIMVNITGGANKIFVSTQYLKISNTP